MDGIKVRDEDGSVREPTKTELLSINEQEREEFEKRVYRLFFIKSVKVNPNSQWMSCTNLTQAELCKRDADGDYEREDVSAMWCGWQLCVGIEL